MFRIFNLQYQILKFHFKKWTSFLQHLVDIEIHDVWSLSNIYQRRESVRLCGKYKSVVSSRLIKIDKSNVS